MSSSDGGTHAPVETITASNRSGYVVLTIYASFFVVLAFWTTRLIIRLRMLGPRWDDLLLTIAMVYTLNRRDVVTGQQLTAYKGLRTRGKHMFTALCKRWPWEKSICC